MDKIREEFEKWLIWYKSLYSGIIITGKMYHAYTAGHKSRDEEIKKLKIKNHRRLRLNRIFMSKNENFLIENKKLRDALKECKHIAASVCSVHNTKEFSEIVDIAYEALKESE